MRHLTLLKKISFFVVSPEDVDERFKVISDYDSAKELYPQIRSVRKCFFLDELDHYTKEQICQDVTSSYLFRQYRLLSRHYRPSNWFRVSTLVNKPSHELVFACAVQRDEQTLKFYVSEAWYNINNIPAHFIFKKSRFGSEIDLYGLAELPAKTVSNVDYNVERIYLERRRYCGMNCRPKREDDALCKLEKRKLVRICIAVFNSNYFETRVDFPVKTGQIYGKCEKITVSFQTEQGKIELGKRTLREWTLSCRYNKNGGRFDYLISQAYRSNEIFVYFRHDDKDVYLENLITNVRLDVDYSKLHSPAYIEEA